MNTQQINPTPDAKNCKVSSAFTLYIIISMLGFSSGLPLALSSTTLQAWFTSSHASLLLIGSLGLLGQPYAYKCFWAPALDYIAPGFLSRRRAWTVMMQAAITIILIAMAFGSPQYHPLGLIFLGFLLAFCSATQDIALDAYRTDILSAQQRGAGTASWVAGYRIGMLVSGGLTLIMADHWGWTVAYCCMAMLVFFSLIISILAPAEQTMPIYYVSLKNSIITPWKSFLAQYPWPILLGFVALYKIGDAFALTLITPFLLRALHFSLTEVGIVLKVGGLIATLLGVFVAGLCLNRLTLYKSLLYFGWLQAISTAFFLLLTWIGPHFIWMSICVLFEQFASGLSMAAFLSFLMSLCDKHYTASQFALLSAIASLGRIFLGPVAGIFVSYFGWGLFFFTCFLLALPGLYLLKKIRHIVHCRLE